MIRFIYCPACNSEIVHPVSLDESDVIYECFDCGRHFTVDEIDKIYIDDTDEEDWSPELDFDFFNDEDHDDTDTW